MPPLRASVPPEPPVFHIPALTETLTAIEKCLSVMQDECERVRSASGINDLRQTLPGVLASLETCALVIGDETVRIKTILEKPELMPESEASKEKRAGIMDLPFETVSDVSDDQVTPYQERSAVTPFGILPSPTSAAAAAAVAAAAAAAAAAARDTLQEPQDRNSMASLKPDTLHRFRTYHTLQVRKERKTFLDPEAMKDRVRQAALNPEPGIHEYYKETGRWQAIARSSLFAMFSFTIIVTNGLWLAVEVSMNDAVFLVDADIGFQLVEHAFCFLFTCEFLIRVFAFQSKLNCFKDHWLIFDGVLVGIMVFETWVMTVVLISTGFNPGSGGGASSSSVLRLARLVKISRVARIGRLLKLFPEINLIVKSLMATIRTVTMIMSLLVAILYIFGIAMTQMCKGSSLEREFFPDVLTAMYSLTLGAIFPDMASFADELGVESWVYAFVFLVFTVISTIIIMNMLIGALVDVVAVVAAVERETIEVTNVKDQLEYIIAEFGLRKDLDGTIAKTGLRNVLAGTEAQGALLKAGVDPYDLPELLDVLFKGRTRIEVREVLDLLLELRANNPTKVKDLTDLRRYMQADIPTKKDLRRLEERIVDAVSASSREASASHTSRLSAAIPGGWQATPCHSASRLESATNSIRISYLPGEVHG